MELVKLFVKEKTPAFIQFNEVGDVKRKYNYLGSHRMITNSDRVGLLYSVEYAVNKILPEMNDNYNLICKCDSAAGSTVIYTAYVPPGEHHNSIMRGLLHRLKVIAEKYAEFSMVLFADLNIPRGEAKQLLSEELKAYGYRIHMNDGDFTYTRTQANSESYLDYFITRNVEVYSLDILKPIGKSDHMTLKLGIANWQAKFKPRRELRMNFQKVKEDAKYISGLLVNTTDPSALIETIRGIQYKHRPIIRKERNMYALREKISNAIEQEKNLSWKTFNKICLKANNEDYDAFMKKFKEDELDNRTREYFLRLRFYTEIGKNSDILKELKCEGEDLDLITDRLEIAKKVTTFYKDLLGDKGIKTKLEPEGDALITLDGNAVDKAISELSLEKATSWDLLPGTAFKEILALGTTDRPKYDATMTNLANMLNQILRWKNLPEEIFTARLVCLNKEAGQLGQLDTIRPIAVMSILQKIVEHHLLGLIKEHIEANDVISKDQLGFMKELGTDVNILKLRIRAKDLIKEKGSKGRKYLLFIDLRKAYDSVVHWILMMKLKQKGFSLAIINTIKKLYSNARLQVDPLTDKIAVNQGVLQGSLISCMLFNVYIDDLVRELKAASFETLAYADDIAVICYEKPQLDKVTEILERWSIENKIEINKKKSGILMLQGTTVLKTLNGFPIVDNYKYLGVTMNSKLNCPWHLHKTKKRLEEYIHRNKLLLDKYFSPRSLLKIFNYYQKSRLTYGMSSFMELDGCMTKLESNFMLLMKSILHLGDSCNHKRLLATLGLPRVRTKLLIQLLKNLKKCEIKLGVTTSMFDEAINMQGGNAIKDIDLNAISKGDLKILERTITQSSVVANAESFGAKVNEVFVDVVYKEWYRFYDRRDGMVIKFFCNIGFFRDIFGKRRVGNDICQHCGQSGNSRNHAIDSCEFYDGLRIETKERILAEVWRNEFEGLELSKMLDLLYFSPSEELKVRRKEMEVLKSVISKVYMTQNKDRLQEIGSPEDVGDPSD